MEADQGSYRLQRRYSGCNSRGGDAGASLSTGRSILHHSAKSEGIAQPVVFQNRLITELAASPYRIPDELRQVIHKTSQSEKLS